MADHLKKNFFLKSINYRSIFLSFFLSLFFYFSALLFAQEADFGAAVPLQKILVSSPDISYKEAYPAHSFKFDPLPVIDNHYLHPFQGVFENTFVLTIPHGQVFGLDGWVLSKGKLIQELIWQNVFPSPTLLQQIKNKEPKSISKKLAVIAQSGYTYYYHWIAEVIGRLALLEMQDIQYDQVYAPMDKPYMQETLALWGIPADKIIAASDQKLYTADQLIVPSLVSKVKTDGCPRLVHYLPKNILLYIRNKFLKAVQKAPSSHSQQVFSRKIFLSRKDATARKMLNEDEVFAIFQEKGFQRYTLSELSIVDQIRLFNQADIVVGALGSNLTNVIFCHPKAQVIDIFQTRRDATIYYLCQNLGLHYRCIKTMEFVDKNDGQFDAVVPLDLIKKLAQDL